jgi:hypothetical protein
MFLEQNEYYALHYEAINSVLTYTAFPNESVMTDEQIKDGFLKTTLIIERFKPKFFISDTSKQMSLIAPDVQTWIAEHIYPRWNKAGLKKLAIVMPEDFFAAIAIETVISEVEQVQAPSTYEIGYFSDLDEAKKWAVL